MGQPEFVIFGDASSTDRFVTVGMMAMPSANYAPFRDGIAAVKENAGVASTAKLHCRVLFNGDARKKSDFAQLDLKSIHQLLRRCAQKARFADARYAVSFVDRTRYPKEMRFTVNGEDTKIADKHLAGMIWLGALRLLEEATGVGTYKLFMDPDRTKLDWGLSARGRADRFYAGWSSPVEPVHGPGLDMADVVAYTANRCLLREEREAEAFVELDRVFSAERAEFQWRPEG